MIAARNVLANEPLGNCYVPSVRSVHAGTKGPLGFTPGRHDALVRHRCEESYSVRCRSHKSCRFVMLPNWADFANCAACPILRQQAHVALNYWCLSNARACSQAMSAKWRLQQIKLMVQILHVGNPRVGSHCGAQGTSDDG